jgi:glycosyltransferase 2 family protein
LRTGSPPGAPGPDDDLSGMASPERPRRARRFVVLALAGLTSLLLVSLVFLRPEWRDGPALVPRFDLGAFARRLPEHQGWLVPFVLLTALLPTWRALVWRVVIAPPRPPFADAWHATALGAFVHNTVPGKTGPVAAAWLLARFGGPPFGTALSSQLVAKLLELAAVVALGITAGAARGGQGAGTRVAIAGAGLVAVLAALAAVLARSGPRLAARLAPRRPRLGAFLGAAADGVRAAATGGRLSRALPVALLPPLTAACAYALPLRAFGVEAPLAGGAIVLALLTFGQLTPGLPVGTGVYYALTAYGARRLGAAPADAAALAVLSHAATVLTFVVIGLLSALARRGALGELVRRRRDLAGAARRVPPSDVRSRMPT